MMEDKTNNEILLEIMQMKHDYLALKEHILQKFDELVAIEEKYAKANELIIKRLKGGEPQI